MYFVILLRNSTTTIDPIFLSVFKEGKSLAVINGHVVTPVGKLDQVIPTL